MDCNDVRRLFYFFLDDALAEEKRHTMLQHIGLCPHCAERMKLQQRLREFVRKRLTPVQAPSHLRVRLSRTLRAVIVE